MCLKTHLLEDGWVWLWFCAGDLREMMVSEDSRRTAAAGRGWDEGLPHVWAPAFYWLPGLPEAADSFISMQGRGNCSMIRSRASEGKAEHLNSCWEPLVWWNPHPEQSLSFIWLLKGPPKHRAPHGEEKNPEINCQFHSHRSPNDF